MCCLARSCRETSFGIVWACSGKLQFASTVSSALVVWCFHVNDWTSPIKTFSAYISKCNVDTAILQYSPESCSWINRKLASTKVLIVDCNGAIYPCRSTPSAKLVLASRSSTESTKQITPPTKNGHAPPPKKTKKELSIRQSLLCLDPVSFTVLNKSNPQTQLLVVSFHQPL